MTCCPGTGPRQLPPRPDLRVRNGRLREGKRPFLTHLFRGASDVICSHAIFAGEEDEMSDKSLSRLRYGEAFWRAHHEAWRRSELNQREYCEAQGIPLKAFEARKLLYRRGGLGHALSHSLSHSLGHMGTSPSYRKAERAPPLTLNDSKAPAPKTTSSRLPELRRKGRPPCRKAGTHSAQQRGVEAP